MDSPPDYYDATSPDTSAAEVVVEDDCVWIRDDFPLWGPASNELSVMDKKLVEWAVSRRCIVTDGISYYVYCRNIASWSQMESINAVCELLDTTETNAAVNYAKALIKFYPLLSRVAHPITHIAKSVCIGTWRLRYMVAWHDSGPVVRYIPHEEVIENIRGTEYARMYMFVRNPIVMPYPFACPYMFKVEMDDPVINEILRPFRDYQKIDFMWRIGRMLTDGIDSQPVVMILYGKDGHEGKSVLAKTISKLLPGTSMWMTDDLIGVKSKWPQPDAVMSMCEKRLLICDEVEIEDGLSYNNIKRWTSNSPVSDGVTTAFLRQNIIATSNKMSFYEKGAINRSIGRRLVIYDLRKYLGKKKGLSDHMITNKIRLKFVSLCLAVSEAYEHPPTNIKTALYTFFRKNINKITAGLIYDPACTENQAIAATTVMAIRCGVPIEQLCSAFSSMSPGLVGETKNGTPYVKSFKPIEKELSEYGHEYVLANRGRAVYDLESLKEIVRLI